MYQPWIFAASLAAGTGLVAFSATRGQPDVDASFVTPEPAPTGIRVVPPPAAEPIAEPPTPAPDVSLAPVVIHAPARHRVAPAPAAAAATAEHPCSTWRSLGPTHVVRGEPSGDVSVRALCP